MFVMLKHTSPAILSGLPVLIMLQQVFFIIIIMQHDNNAIIQSLSSYKLEWQKVSMSVLIFSDSII